MEGSEGRKNQIIFSQLTLTNRTFANAVVLAQTSYPISYKNYATIPTFFCNIEARVGSRFYEISNFTEN